MSLNTETLFQTLRLMIVAGGKQEKERKNNEGWFVQSGTRKERRS